MERLGPSSRTGFSLVELMLAMTITLGVSLIVFQMFAENQRVFRDQALVLEMQQNARAVVSMIADDLRKAGQGVPVYASSHDTAASEASVTFLAGTNASDLRFRAGIGNGTARARAPLTYTVDSTSELDVDAQDASRISDLVGAGTGRHVYIWGPRAQTWTWVRAEITAFLDRDTILVTPRQIGGEGGTFTATPSVSLEEGVSYRLSSGRILRGVARDFTSPTAPAFTESTVADGFTVLQFSYYDASGAAIDPTTLALRSGIRRVDFLVDAETSAAMADGSKRNYAVSVSVRPRNLEIY